MAYTRINPFTEQVVKTYDEHTDAELEGMLARADTTYRDDWRLRPVAQRRRF